MFETLQKSTVVAYKSCPACTSNQAFKVTKSGMDVCQICGMCSCRVFYGRAESQDMIKRHMGAQKPANDNAAPAPKTPTLKAVPDTPQKPKSSAADWIFNDDE